MLGIFQDIKALLESWKSDLASCDKIFIRAPGGNKRLFLHGKSPPFNKDDERVRMVPFPTRRPTLNEVRRVFEMLSSIECYGKDTTCPSPFECTFVFCVLVVHFPFITVTSNLLAMSYSIPNYLYLFNFNLIHSRT